MSQDFRLSELFASEGKAVVLVVNKWDRVDPSLWTIEKMTENVKAQLRSVGWATVVCTSALRGERAASACACTCMCITWSMASLLPYAGAWRGLVTAGRFMVDGPWFMGVSIA